MWIFVILVIIWLLSSFVLWAGVHQLNFHFLHMQHAHHRNHNLSPDHLAQVAVEHGESCGRDLKLAADRVSQSEQEVEMMTIMNYSDSSEDDGFP